jgi:hypothetical protein
MHLTPLTMMTIALLLAVAFLIFRDRILGALRRFDARNRARRVEEVMARYDRDAHYRQTVALAEEQVEQVTKIHVKDERTGEDLVRHVFQGEHYATQKEAEEARFAAIVAIAREFYDDLDKIYLGHSARREAMGNRSEPR